MIELAAPSSSPAPVVPLGKAGAVHRNLVLLPSKEDPSIKRWQTTEGRVASEHVQAGARFDVGRDLTLHVDETDGDHTRVHWGRGSRWHVPTAALPQYIHDLRGELHHAPTSGHPTLDAVLRGEGAHLGKGNDGVVFRHGDRVVKAATVVPYVPENGGRTLDEASRALGREAAAHRALADLPHVQAIDHVEHEGRAFLVKPYLMDTGRLTRGELDALAQTVERMHGRGWVVGDQIQTGRDPGGHVKLMDLGQARHTADPDAQEADLRHLDELYREHGQHREALGLEEGRNKLRVADTLLGMAVRAGDVGKAQLHLAQHTRLTRGVQAHLLVKEFEHPEGSDEAAEASAEWVRLHDAHKVHAQRVADLVARHEADVAQSIQSEQTPPATA